MASNRDINDVPWQKPERDYLMDLFQNYWATLVISPACELKVFDQLEGDGKTAEQVAGEEGWHAGNTGRLLDTLTSLKLLTKTQQAGRGVTYKNTEFGSALRTGPQQSMKPIFMMFTKVIGKAMSELAHEVRTGAHAGEPKWLDLEKAKMLPDPVKPPAQQIVLPKPPSDHKGNSQFMYGVMESMVGPYVDNLLSLHDFSQYKTAVDIGGGTGILSYSLSRKYPEMSVTVLEMASVVKIAKESFLPKDFAELRVDFIEGDCFEIDMPSADLFVICKVIHHFTITEIHKFLTIVYEKLPIGGSLMILENAMENSKDGCAMAHLMDLFFMSRGVGSNRSFGEYVDLLEENKFKKIQCSRSNEQCMYDVILATKV